MRLSEKSFSGFDPAACEAYWQLNILVTARGRHGGTGPILFVPAIPNAALPGHPRSLEWRYFATIPVDDHLLVTDRDIALQSIRTVGFYIANRVI